MIDMVIAGIGILFVMITGVALVAISFVVLDEWQKDKRGKK